MQLPPYGSNQLEVENPFGILPRLKQKGLCLESRLEHQYRMHFTIANFLDLNVYDGRLKTPLEARLNSVSIGARSPISWIDIKTSQSRRGTSTLNFGEVDAVKSIIVKRGLKPTDYAVVTGYDAQRGAMSRALKDLGSYHNERVYTIDSYQGHEAPIVFVSVARTSQGLGFMSGQIGQKRVNVMLSRAKDELVVLGKLSHVLKHDRRKVLLTAFGLYCDENGAVFASATRYLQNSPDIRGPPPVLSKKPSKAPGRQKEIPNMRGPPPVSSKKPSKATGREKEIANMQYVGLDPGRRRGLFDTSNIDRAGLRKVMLSEEPVAEINGAGTRKVTFSEKPVAVLGNSKRPKARSMKRGRIKQGAKSKENIA